MYNPVACITILSRRKPEQALLMTRKKIKDGTYYTKGSGCIYHDVTSNSSQKYDFTIQDITKM
jgi:hypothetical protein